MKDRTWANPITSCRYCNKSIDRINDSRDSWYERARGWTYHRECWEKFSTEKELAAGAGVHSTSTNDEAWYDCIYDYLVKDLKMEVDYTKARRQFVNFLKDGTMTGKGIYFCLRYFYDIKKGDVSKANGGIGIVSYLYQESYEYWAERSRREVGLIEKITAQALARASEESPKVVTQKRQSRKTKNAIDLAAIALTEEE